MVTVPPGYSRHLIHLTSTRPDTLQAVRARDSMTLPGVCGIVSPMGFPEKITGASVRSAAYTAAPYGPPHGCVWFLFALIAVLPAVVWGNSGSPGQPPPGGAPATRQTGIGESRGNAHLDALAPLPAAQSRSTAGSDGKALSEKYDLALGKSVFTHACLSCHGNSVRDAPRVGDMSAWQPRLAQGLDVLIQHALAGHGRMPPKGGYFTLTDREVSSAVAYIYQMGTEILAQPANPITHSGCDSVSIPDQCSPEELRRLLILQILWLLSGPHQ
jgi:cytochrome c5